jgi:hypothetical protein
MGSLFNPSILFITRCMPFTFHSSSLEWVLIDFKKRQTTSLIDQIEFSRYSIYKKWILRYTLFFDAPSTMRSEGGSIACSENLRPSLDFSDIVIRDVYPYICRRLSSSECILFILPSGPTLHRGSLHFS